MPLRCLDPKGRSIHSIDLTYDQWRVLESENRKARHLRMPCCSSRVTLKRSRLGTPFFAHKAISACATTSETEEHLHLKRMAVEAARANGWTADAEVTGTSPSGDEWRADVLARKGNHKVAVEIQWSRQSNAEMLRRQKVYREAGVRGLWLLRQPGFPITRELPAVCVGGSLNQGFSALIPALIHWSCGMSARDRSRPERWHQVVSMEELLDAAFSRRFRFGVPADADASVSIRGYVMKCRYWDCEVQKCIVTSVEVAFGPNKCVFAIQELEKHPILRRTVIGKLPDIRGIGEIRPLVSRTQGRSYMSSVHSRCESVFGIQCDFSARNGEEALFTFPIQISGQWQRVIERRKAHTETWGVYPAASPAVEAPSVLKPAECSGTAEDARGDVPARPPALPPFHPFR